MDLNVPYAEKDEAKRLGARWSPERRCWYVPAGSDPLPLSRWWITRETTPSLSLRAPEAYLVRSPAHCWRCGSPITVIGFLLAPSFEVNDAWESGEEAVVDHWSAYEDWGFAHYIEELSSEVAEIASAASPTYRPGFSKTMQCQYWANHCSSCRALQGDFNLFSEPGGAFMPMTEQDAQLMRATRVGVLFEASAEFSLGVDVATAIPGVRDSLQPGRKGALTPIDPSSVARRQSSWSRFRSLFGGRDR